MKNQAADAISSPPTGGTEKTKLNRKILVQTITTNLFNNDETEQRQEDRKNYDEPTKQELDPYLPELHALADQIV